VLILLVLSRTDSSSVRSEPEEIVSIDLSIAPPPLDRQDEKALDAAGKRTPGGVSKRKPQNAIEPASGSDADSEQEAVSPESPRALAAESAIDWGAEAQRSARRAAAAEKGPRARAFGTIPESPYRPCAKRESSFTWDPEPKKAGFAGGLPYVRVGKRCIVGLGFFGCEIGALTPANGTLLDDMKTDYRERSSVPHIDECLQATPMDQPTPELRPEQSPQDVAR
jgi:hypothetical protein